MYHGYEQQDPPRPPSAARRAWRGARRRIERGADRVGDALLHLTPRQAAIGAGLFLLVLVLLWQRCGLAGCPNVEMLRSYTPGGAPALLDRHGEEFAELTPVDHEIVSLADLPEHVADAFIAVEDQRFHEHDGVDWRRVFGAAWHNVTTLSFAEGFSTIPMQLSRNVFRDRIRGEEKTLRRKLLEIRVAGEIEDSFSKDEILELYLNHIYFGGGVWGIEAASRHFFGRSAADLSLRQAALLAALPKAPNNYDPRVHPERARARRDLVLSLMAEQGRIDTETAESEAERGLGVLREPPRARSRSHETGYYVEAVRRVLESRFGDDLYTAPVRIHTTLDVAAQSAAADELDRQIRGIERGRFGRIPPAPADTADNGHSNALQGAVVVVDPDSGDVLAMVGGRDFSESRFDRAILGRRQAGSAFKPFVYAAALARGRSLADMLDDGPLEVDLRGGGVWRPRNFDGRNGGSITLRDALVHSRNIPTVRLAMETGEARIGALARSAGIRSDVPTNPAMALGVAAVSPLDMAAAYTMFASLGTAVEPRFIRRVEGEDGEILWAPPVERARVLDPIAAYLTTDALRDAVDRGTGAVVRRVGARGPVAGKTGTTNDALDTWFVGYTPALVGVVWIGFDRPRPLPTGATGGRLAAPVFGHMLRRIQRTRPLPDPWARPAGITEARIDPGTGLVLEKGCIPRSGTARTELFRSGSVPAASCPRTPPPPSSGVWDRIRIWIGDVFGEDDPPGRDHREREDRWHDQRDRSDDAREDHEDDDEDDDDDKDKKKDEDKKKPGP